MAEEKPKIIVDDDWKSQAQQEKERLAETIEEQAGSEDLPEASFSGLVQLIAMQAMVGLGGFAGSGGQRIPPNLDLARHHIDMLEVLDKKTAGNLSDEEKRLLDVTQHQLRMAYVEVMQGSGGDAPGGMPKPKA